MHRALYASYTSRLFIDVTHPLSSAMPVTPDITSKRTFTLRKLRRAIEQRKKNDLTDKLVHARFCSFALFTEKRGKGFCSLSRLIPLVSPRNRWQVAI